MKGIALGIAIFALCVLFFILIAEINGVERCDHCGYTKYLWSRPTCGIPGCNGKTPHFQRK